MKKVWRFDVRRSVKVKMLSLILVVIIVPLAIVGVLSVLKTTQNTTEMVEERLDELSMLLADSIDDALDSAHNLTEVLSMNALLGDFITGDNSVKNDVYAFLGEVYEKNNDKITLMAIADANGIVKMTHADKAPSIDISDREYFKQSIKGQPGESDIIFSREDGSQVIAISYPLHNKDKIVGVLLTTIKFEDITKKVDNVKIFKDGYGYMFDKEGMVVAHPNKDNIMTLNLSELGISEINDMLSDVKAEKGGKNHYTYKDVYKFVTYKPAGKFGVAVTANYDDYMETSKSITFLLILVAVISGIIAIVVAYLFTEMSIVRPLRQVSEKMKLAGLGDLTVTTDIRTKDEIQEIGEAFNDMIMTQNSIVSSVKINSHELASSSDEIAISTTQLSESSEDIAKNVMGVSQNVNTQNKSIIDTSEVLLQLASMIQLAKASAVKADVNAHTSLSIADNGTVSVETTIEAIEGIQVSSIETTEYLVELEKLSTEVKGIIDTINGIAEQTNLLALNASIEAARAGDQGKGFAVVAEEVRKLAEQTGDEASGITKVVINMIDKIKQAVNSMEKGNDAVNIGVERSSQTSKAFVEIQTSVNNIAKDIQGILELTEDEVASSDAIVNLINQIASLSEENSTNSQSVAAAIEEQTALSETLAAGSEELNAMANEMNELVDRFKTMEV